MMYITTNPALSALLLNLWDGEKIIPGAAVLNVLENIHRPSGFPGRITQSTNAFKGVISRIATCLIEIGLVP